MGTKKYVKGDLVEVLQEYQDAGDDECEWVCVDDEEKGRVTIANVNNAMRITPTHVVNVEWIRHKA